MIGQFKKIILVLGDIFVLYLALWLALFIRFQEAPAEDVLGQHFWPFTVLFGVWLVIFFINGLFDLAASNNDIGFYNKILRNLLINFGIAAGYFYLLTDKLFDIKPQTVFFIFAGVFTILFYIWRYGYNTFIQRPGFLRRVLIIGMNDEAKELLREIIKKPQLGYRIAAIVHDGFTDKSEFSHVVVHNSSVDLKKILKDYKITTVVTVLDPRTNPRVMEQLFSSIVLKLQFFDLPTFYEKLTGKIPVTNIGHIWFLENLAEGEKGVYEALKKTADIAAAAAGLILSAPLVPLIALAIRLDSPGPILFRQTRIGYLGRPFLAVKFRSMVVGAEKSGQPQWAAKDDPRVTRVGYWLRKLRLDEIPQLLNVLKAEMSLIGPRPERPEFVKQLQEIIPFYNERNLVKPGLTGWAQINFGYGETVNHALKKLQYDLFYIKNRSLPLDLGIILKTINIILSGRGQ